MTDWLDVVDSLGPAATLVVATVAAVVGFRTLRQKSRADALNQWWTRAQWAIDQVIAGDTAGNDDQVAIGLIVLEHLALADGDWPDETLPLPMLTNITDVLLPPADDDPPPAQPPDEPAGRRT